MLNKYPDITLLTNSLEKLVIHSANFCAGASQNLELKLIDIPVGNSPFLLLLNRFESIWAMFDVLYSLQAIESQARVRITTPLPTRELRKMDFIKTVVRAFVEKLSKRKSQTKILFNRIITFAN